MFEKLKHSIGASIKAWGFSSYEGANNSTVRTQVPYRNLEVRKDIDSFTRSELLRKYRWLRANLGLVRRLVNGTAQYAVGTGIVPSATTLDPAWNALSDTWFKDWASSKDVDVTGRQNLWSLSYSAVTHMIGDGECFTAKVLRTDEKTGLSVPQIQLFEANEIGDAAKTTNPPETTDGLGLDEFSKTTFYRVLSDDTGKNYRDIPADQMVHLYDTERAGQIRGLTWLYHGVNSLVDIMDLTAMEKQTTKVHSTLAAAVKSKSATAGPGGLSGQLQSLLTKAQRTADPTAQNAYFEKMFGGGFIPFLNDGEELQLLSSSRSSAVFTGFLDWLVRDIAWGFGVSPEFIWAVSGMGGANTRFILEDASWFFSSVQQMLIDDWMKPIRTFALANAMLLNKKNPGLGLPPCKDPRWWEAHYQTPRKVSVDEGKTGQLDIDRLAVGMETLDDWWGANRGTSGMAKAKKRIDEVAELQAYAKTKGVEYEEVFPPQAGAAKKQEGPADRPSMK